MRESPRKWERERDTVVILILNLVFVLKGHFLNASIVLKFFRGN